jgi:hypothetical protein
VQEEGDIIGLKRGEGGGEVRGPVGWAIAGGDVSSNFSVRKERRGLPELEVNDTFYTNLWYVVVVEEGVCDT